MTAIRLQQPQALLQPQIQQLLKRAVETGIFLAPGGFDSVAQDIINFVTDPRQFMVLGAEKGEFRCVCLGYMPNGNLFPFPTIVLIYNEGSRDLSKEVQDTVMDILISNGYTKALAVNTSGHSDAAWLKTLTPEGATSEKVGSLVLFEVK